MLVLGDLACPNSECAKRLKKCMEQSGVFKSQTILCNLEGVICDDDPYCDEKLFNHSDVLDAFEPSKTVFSIANNHTYDYPRLIETTEKMLTRKGFFVNGILRDGLIEPTVIEEDNVEYAIFTHCWRVYTLTNPNQSNSIRIIDCSYDKFFQCVKKYAEANKERRVICFFHWNYDMETIPFPAYRKLAHDLIDVGVYAVIGNHSHVPQGGEVYKERIIIYGLGNFYIPSGKFFAGELIYPESSKRMMVVDFRPDNDILFHWFETDGSQALKKEKTESIENCDILISYSPYMGMNDKDYLSYFKANRVKRTLVPVFNVYKGPSYRFKELLAINRIKLIKFIKR